mgnify:CR=1 FL=1
MRDLLAFDLDGTLCPVGKGMAAEDAALLRELEDSGCTIIISSGKPTYYLCGFARQLDLGHPILVGENGGTFQFGVGLPPERYYEYPFDQNLRKALGELRARIDRALAGRIWYQPNEIALTPFPRDAEAFEVIQQILDDSPELLSGIAVYRQSDCFDILPDAISKRNGLQYLADLLGADRSRFAAVGDGINDVPMFDYADLSISIGGKLAYRTDLAFDTIHEALCCLKEKTPSLRPQGPPA